MLVPVDEIRLLSERPYEGRELRVDLGPQCGFVETAQERVLQRSGQRPEGPLAQRMKPARRRTKRRGQREMQADLKASSVIAQPRQRRCFVRIEGRSNRHDRGRVEASAGEEIADRGIDAGGDAVIVRA
jgi:hypothetical protein